MILSLDSPKRKLMYWRVLFRVIWFLTIGVSINVNGQDPVFFTIGKYELQDLNVYNLLETSRQELYIATDLGLYRYENQLVKAIEFGGGVTSRSLFYLVENSMGDVFCIDLKGNIFQVVQNELILFFSFKNEFIHKLPTLICDINDNLVVTTGKKCFTISPQGTLIHTIEEKLFLHQLNDKSYFYFLNNQLFYESKGLTQIFDVEQIDFDDEDYMSKVIFLMSWISQNNHSKIEIIPRLDSINLDHPFRVFDKIFQDTDTSFYIRRSSSSFYKVVVDNKKITVQEQLFKETFVSSFEIGASNILYFGTFKQGIHVIPKLNLRKYNTTFKPASILDLAVSENNNLYFSIYRNGIYQMENGKSKLVYESDVFPYSKIFYSKKVFDKNMDQYVLTDKMGACKDLKIINDSTELLLTNSHLFLHAKLDTFHELDWINEYSLPHYKHVFGRNKSIEFDSKLSVLFVGNQYNLFKINRGDIPEIINYEDNAIDANDLEYDNDTLWIADSNNGVLALVNNQVIQMFTSEDGLLNNRISRIIKREHLLYLVINHKLHIVNTQSGTINILGKSDGITGLVNNIKISKDRLWVLIDNSQVSAYNLTDFSSIRRNCQLDFSRLLNEDQSIDYKDIHTFHVDHSNLLFSFRLNNTLETENFDLCYSLKGSHFEKQCIPFKNNAIKYKTLPVGDYTLSAFARSGSFQSNHIHYSFSITPPFWKKTWFILLISFFTICLLTCILYFYLRQLKQKNQQKLLESEMKSEIIEYQLKSMRSQMNPHFIFNSLNSIQELVLQSKPIVAYDYIEMFAQLVRNVLTFSEKSFIPLSTEIAFLKVYLQLESLRFDDAFTYNIDLKENLDLRIPSLLIQPFVENAIHHGLLSKKGEKNIQIKFEQKDNILECSVIDNGIGRSNSLKNNKSNKRKEDSFAMNSIKRRMLVFKNKFDNENIGFEIIDLNFRENSVGTQVIIRMPFHKN